MADAWPAIAAGIAVVGTILGVTLTQRSERRRQANSDRQRGIEWSRDRRLNAYQELVSSVSRRVSALAGLRKQLNRDGEPVARWHADEALADLWMAVRRVRLVGPDEVANLAEKLARHYEAIDDKGFPAHGGSAIEEDFGRAARAAIQVPEHQADPAE